MGFDPSWQNSIDSIIRKSDYFKKIGVFKNGELAGYGIIEKHTGDIPQLAISKKYRRIGLGAELLKKLVSLNKNEIVKFVNSESDYEPFRKFATSIGFPLGLGQYEMTLDL